MENVEAARAYEELLKKVGIDQKLAPPLEENTVPEFADYSCCTNDPNDIIMVGGAYVCWHCGSTVCYKILVYCNPYQQAGKPVGSNTSISFEKKRGYKVLIEFPMINKLEFDPF